MPRGVYIRTKNWAIDITGQRFGKLIALMPAYKKGNNYYWLFKCDCGKQVICAKHHIISSVTKSCGCFRKEFMKGQPEEKHGSWKGNTVGIWGLHDWVEKHLGRPKKCEHCGTTEAKKFDWANKSRRYKRDLNDWLRLCRSCHIRYDMTPERKLKLKKNMAIAKKAQLKSME